MDVPATGWWAHRDVPLMRWLRLFAALLLINPAQAYRGNSGGVSPPVFTTHQVSNAPVWTATTSYTHTGHIGDRVLVSTGYSGGNWTDGTPVYLLELTTGGTSGGSMPAPGSCPSTGIADGGSVVWKCLTQIDYVDATSALNDDPIAWQAGGQYRLFQTVYFNKAAWYMCAGPTPSGVAICPGSSFPSGPGFVCTAGSTGPTVAGGPNLDGTCAWKKLADVVYSSDHSQAWLHGFSAWNGTSYDDWSIRAITHHTFELWSGGFASPTYTQILSQGHNNPINPMTQIEVSEGTTFCPGTGDTNEQAFVGCWSSTIEASATDGYCHTWPPGTALAYDSLPAVKIEHTSGDDYAGYFLDGGLYVNCLQFKNTGTAFPAVYTGAFPFTANNGGYMLFENNIVDCNSSVPSCIVEDDATRFQNNLIISRYTGANAVGIETKYQHAEFSNTIVQLGGSSNSVPMLMACMSQFNSFDSAGTPTIRDNIYIGWANPIASAPCAAGVSYTGNSTSNNATDLANITGSGAFVSGWSGNGAPTSAILGTSNLFSQSPSAIFVSPTDFNLAVSSPVKGAGANYSVSSPGNFAYTASTFDMFGTARGANPIDIGPVQ